MESENLKSSKKRAEEDLKVEKMWSAEKKLEVERLEAEVKGLEQIKDEFGTKVEENKLLCENAFFRSENEKTMIMIFGMFHLHF